MTEAAIEQAAALVAAARSGLAFTGAGISTESGIPDFRGPNGLWKTADPKTSSIDFFRADPAAYWTISRDRYPKYQQAAPNRGHLSLAALEQSGHLAGVVTQNTDGLHLDAGSRTVVEVHGNGRRVRCLECAAVEPRDSVQGRLDRELPPRCHHCGGSLMKPDVVLFGEPMPAGAMAAAYSLAGGADLVLVVGSTLAVYPAADIPLAALRAGAPMVIVNAEPTPFDELAAVVIRGRAGEVLDRLQVFAGG